MGYFCFGLSGELPGMVVASASSSLVVVPFFRISMRLHQLTVAGGLPALRGGIAEGEP